MSPLNKRYLLQLAESANLTAAVITGLAAIYPLLSSNNPNWLQVIILFVLTVFFAVAHSLVAHIKNGDLQAALSNDISMIEEAVKGWTRQFPAIPKPLRLPDNPPQG